MNITTRLLATIALWLGAGCAGAINIVQNPGFELGSANWESERFLFHDSPLWAHTEPGVARLAYCSHENCLDTVMSGAFVSQLLSTRPGDRYDLSFWVRSFNGESRLSVFWDGALLGKTGTPNGPMQQYSFSGLVASANATLLEVHGFNGSDRHMSFDDFSVERSGPMMPAPPGPLAVAEPLSGALLLAALGAMVLVRRRRG